ERVALDGASVDGAAPGRRGEVRVEDRWGEEVGIDRGDGRVDPGEEAFDHVQQVLRGPRLVEVPVDQSSRAEIGGGVDLLELHSSRPAVRTEPRLDDQCL